MSQHPRLTSLHRVGMMLVLSSAAVAGCRAGDPMLEADPLNSAAAESEATTLAPSTTLYATVGVPFVYDATAGGTTVNTSRGTRSRYAVSFAPSANGLVATGGRINGVPLAAMTVTSTVTVTDVFGKPTSSVVTIIAEDITPPAVASPLTAQGATVGSVFSFDATRGGTTFSGTGLTYTVDFSPTANGLTAANGRITGTPASAAIIGATVTATDAAGRRVSATFPIVAFGADLTEPSLPGAPLAYSDASSPLPAHFRIGGPGGPPGGGSVIATDNTPAANVTTDAGATLGRVLFYDRRLSANDRVSCSSCHQQQFAFSDTARLSRGFNGGLTGRHSMGLDNARFYQRGRFFWDERAATLEAQVLQPIQDATEMGMTLDQVVTKVSLSRFYAPLFQAAFGSPEVTSDRMARALAQFVRSLVTTSSKFDRAFAGTANPNFNAVFTAAELRGQQIFNGQGNCAACHATNAHVSDDIHNNGLDAVTTDAGAGQGRFKATSLRNVEKRGRFMHDGRFTSLEQVVEFYNSGVQANPNLDPRMRGRNGAPNRLNLTQGDKDALVAYMKTFTDDAFLTNAKFSSPFGR